MADGSIRLSVATGGGHDASLTDLAAWLRRDPELRPGVELKPAEEVPGDTLGGTDVLSIVLEPVSVAAFFAAAKVWLNRQRSKVTLHVRMDNQVLDLSIDSMTDPDEFVQSVISAIRLPKTD